MIIQRRLKTAFLILTGIIAGTVIGGVLYLESERFASVVKRLISQRSPEQLGIVGDFSNLKLYFFPPGVGVANPKIHINKENVSKLPIEGDIEAKELRIRFAPIQMLSGTLVVSKVEVNSGAVQGHVFAEAFKQQKKAPKPKTEKFTWQDLIQLQINGFHFEDTYLSVEVELPQNDHPLASAEFVVKNLDLEKTSIDGKTAIVSTASVNAVKVEVPDDVMKLPIKEAHQLQWGLQLTDEGLKLEPFDADLAGIHVKLDGLVTGNIFDPKSDLKLSADSQIESDLGTFFGSNLNDENWGGNVLVNAKVEGKLSDLAHSLKASYSMHGKDIEWKSVHASKLDGAGTLDLARGRIELQNFDIEDQANPESVGKLKVENLLIPLEWDEGFQAKLQLENADIHWLGGVVIKDVFMLDGKITGDIKAAFNPGQKVASKTAKKLKWKLGLDTDLHVGNFALTNQKYGELRPKKYILRPTAPLHLKGGLEISSIGLEYKNFSVSMPHSNFNVTGGVYGGDGYSFEAIGPIDLRDMGEIAQNPIRGTGELHFAIHGPASGVILDFNTKLKDASYMGLLFGDIQGMVTYDDGISELRFTNINANQKNTFYSIKSGFIDLSGGDDVHLPFQIHSGKVEDLATVLDPLVRKISWYPKTLSGEIHGGVELSGKIDMPKLEIHSSLEGSDWTWMGERARKVKMDFGYDKGTYFAREVDISKTNGSIKGDIEFNSNNDEMDWDFVTENMSFADIDFMDRLEIPARSKFEITSKGSGTMDKLKSKTEGRFYQTEVKGETLDSSHFSLEIGESTLRANAEVFGTRAVSQIKYALTPKQPSSIKIDFNKFDFTPALLVLNPKLLDDPELEGKIDGKIQLDFLSTQSELARGEVQIQKYHLAKTGFRLDLIDPLSVPIQLGYFNFAPARFQFKNATLAVSGEGQKGEVDIRAKGQTDLALVEFVSSTIQKMEGQLNTELSLTGPLKQLRVNGDLDFSGGRAQLRVVQTPLEDMDGTVRIRQGTVYVQSIDSNFGDETFTMSGKVETFTDRFPILDMKMQFENNKIKMLPLSLVQPRGTAFIRGDQAPYTISGNLEIIQALWTRSFSQGGGASVRGDRFAPTAKEKQAATGLFALDLNVVANQGFFVKNEILDAEFKGRFRLIGPPDNPKLLGEGSLVQGKALFRDRPFVFDSIKVDFDDPYELNPKFTASAVSEVNQYKVRVLAFGRADSWKAEFSSTPYLAESEIFSLLASGLTSAENSRFKSRDRTYVNQGEAASLILHSMDFSRDVQNRTGLQFDVAEAVDYQSANSIFKPQSVGENVAAPKLVIKRKLGAKVDLSFGSTVGVGNQNQKEVSAEYSITPGMSVLGVWNNIEDATAREERTSFGMDLKFNKKFK
ncbi:MAG: translocation/assembly module TamB domain-containing protein [Bdellovibrionales bacterium]|nr:translocation/assembly module TamB domain-containing protein [Bdellovibrionales bacterium]